MKKTMTFLTAVLGATALTTAAAGPQLSAQSIIVNPIPTPLTVQVWTDRDTSGARTPNYYVNDKIRLFTKTNENAYVYLFNVDPNGKVDLILPNNLQSGGNYLRAGETRVFPSASDNFTFDIAAPYGVNKVLALASRTQLNLNQLANFQTQSGFANVNVSGQNNLAQALSIVVNPLPQNTWITDTALYNVARGSAQTPAPSNPVSTAPRPNFNLAVWRANFNLNATLDNVHAQYVRYMGNQGYSLTSTSRNGERMYSTFKRNGQSASVLIEKNGIYFSVKVAQ
ncbi:DUF4384 domain-containing protein [Deinococcus radiophilus]|uniref:DUF4384 domain-containing protein n=2 Tax=Deinococcus radiophilus TaxID=32062 RepID=A0A3S0ID26_9DEIO|nr:DUF4384 domain-containing protein [Deinococcus radiophilus]RTR29865.1 DUF4384 domain-containing protein [Deinococcus radiophilus]UFA49782.1 DUF4384 domain-containing protein [Deinococcus radiophilus]